MTKEELAKQINAVKDLGRIITTNFELDFIEGEIYDNRGKSESWTDRDKAEKDFIPESDRQIMYVLQCDQVPCHAVDYTNPEEREILGAEDCEHEAECLVPANTKMQITYVSGEYDFEEMGYYIVEMEVIK